MEASDNGLKTGRKQMSVERAWGQQKKKAIAHQRNTQQLWALYEKSRAETVRNWIAIANDGLAMEIAHRFRKVCNVELEDLAQFARIGLLKAIEKFEPAKGNAFSSFAVPYIRGEILHYLRDTGWDAGIRSPRRCFEQRASVRKIRRHFLNAGRDLSEEKIAEGLGITASRWQFIVEATDRKSMAEFEECYLVPVANDGELAEEEQLRRELRSEVAKLPNPYRQCITEHYFGGLRKEAIAKQSGRSLAEVEACLQEGLNRLKSGKLGRREIG